jgi:hypothetical protein
MKNISFYIETAAIQSNILEQAISAKLSSGDGINVPFENVFSFTQTNSGGGSYNQRFSVSSQSVNKAIAISQEATDLQPPADGQNGQRKFVNGIPQALRRNVCDATQAQFSINNQYSPNYQINSEVTTALNFVSPAFGTQNYQMSNGLVETVAAMDIPDYDYECGHKLTSITQMPFEFVGGGLYVSNPDANLRQIQPPSSQISAVKSGRGLLGTLHLQIRH